MSTVPARMADAEAPKGTALIGKSVVVKGQIFSREDLYVDGEVEGTLELQDNRLTVGPNGTVKANIKAKEAVIIGTVHGNIEAAEKLDIRKDAKLVGDVKTARIVIEDGAYFKGSIDITRGEPAKPAAVRPQPTAAAGAAPSASAPAASKA
ncbi:MAG: polymer-forming cytoskeletal protein [Bryobacterales bacterium]|nr:polymer-forming cytoskeletal protein [Bryobacteraceae bacterium]MDW8354583.1 polymer-forming cytoskeletal protein [Bryobacterales bacterium]